jgi:hypothetical protein
MSQFAGIAFLYQNSKNFFSFEAGARYCRVRFFEDGVPVNTVSMNEKCRLKGNTWTNF